MTPALILAAGRGERMRPLTDTCPKPLLAVRGKPLMQWHMEALARGGCTALVVNTAWLGSQIANYFGTSRLLDGSRTLSISYSDEQADFGGALETAGGIARALPLLQAGGQDVFWLVAGDVYAPDFSFEPAAVQRFAASGALAHLWLVPNPAHNPRGDFGLAPDGRALNGDGPDGLRHTYSTIALLKRQLFEPPLCGMPAGNPRGAKAPLAPLLRRAMDNGRVTAELYGGEWTDVGTPERLAQLNATTPST
jgi:MurNAc alpha-1-phosphate uridylyltransferase